MVTLNVNVNLIKSIKDLKGSFFIFNAKISFIMEQQKYKNCQSCGMPLKSDKGQPVHNSDGSKNTMYCSHCFKDGEFVDKDMTLAEMQRITVNHLTEKMHFPKFLANAYVKKQAKLERWK